MKVEIDVPESLNEITLEQYQAFLRIYDSSDSEEFIGQKMVSIFCKIPLSHVLKINAKSVSEVIADLNNMFEGNKPLKTRFKLGDVEFGFLPSIEDMSFGEYIDLETNISDWQTMHKAMAVMYRPITEKRGDKYLIEQYESTANYSDVMKYAPLDVVMGAMVFFYSLGNELLKATLDYLTEEATKMIYPKKRSSVKIGDGTHQSTHSLRATLSSLEMSLNSLSEQPLLSSPLSNRKTK